MAKITPKQRKAFLKAFQTMHGEYAIAVAAYQQAILQTLDAHDFRTNFDLADFAREAYLHQMKDWHTQTYAEEAAAQEAKDILNGLSE